MKLIVTIDTEEDNWNRYSRTENPCSNIEQLLPLQDLFDRFNVVPTYLITYPVVRDEKSQSILNGFLSEGKCEIGTHCHPWNTPPFEEVYSKKNTMLLNLPYELILKKIINLHNAIIDTFGIIPSTFRSGRFGFSSSVAKVLAKLGYAIDTSITPYKDWFSNNGPDFSSCSPEPYIFSENDIFIPRADGSLVEIPLSIGFLQKNFTTTNFLHKFFSKNPLKWLKIVGILENLHLMNMVWLCPELNTENQMIGLTKVLMEKKYSIINMMFHSTSLKAGYNNFVKTKKEEDRMFHRIGAFLQFAKDIGIEPGKVSDCAELIRSGSVTIPEPASLSILKSSQ